MTASKGMRAAQAEQQTAMKQLQTAFVNDVFEEWKRSGPSALKIMAVERPQDFVKVVAQVLPKEIELDLANYVARVPHNIIDVDEWQTLNQDLITKQP